MVNKKVEQAELLDNVVSYPTTPDKEGYFFEDATEEARDIQTKEYQNGNRIKRFFLSNGKECVVRELTGKEVLDAQKVNVGGKGNEAKIVNVIAAMATLIDDKGVIPEDLENYKARDYLKITQANAQLNLL